MTTARPTIEMQQEQPHIPAALLHESPKTSKHYFFDPSRFTGTYCALRQ